MIKLKPKSHEKSEDFTVEFPKPLKLKKLALQSFTMTVSWFNITDKTNMFDVYTDENNVKSITIPYGNKNVEDLNIDVMKAFGSDDPPVKFGRVQSRLRMLIKLTKGWNIDLTKSDFHKLIGFEKKVYESHDEETVIEGENIADITNGNDIIYIHCDVVNGSLINQNNSEVIYSFTPRDVPGVIVSKEFNNLIYYPVNRDSIRRIRMRVTNQNGELIDLNKGLIEYNFRVVEEKEDYVEKIYQLILTKFSQ